MEEGIEGAEADKGRGAEGVGAVDASGDEVFGCVGGLFVAVGEGAVAVGGAVALGSSIALGGGGGLLGAHCGRGSMMLGLVGLFSRCRDGLCGGTMFVE